jgi:hypothetical protein
MQLTGRIRPAAPTRSNSCLTPPRRKTRTASGSSTFYATCSTSRRAAASRCSTGGEKGAYWFRTVTGATPDRRRTLVIWRKLTGNSEEDNLALDEWFTKQAYSSMDSEFGLIYINGGNNLENLKTPDDLWKVRLIEEDFHRLMFETEGMG